jgi:hypothetical protein
MDISISERGAEMALVDDAVIFEAVLVDCVQERQIEAEALIQLDVIGRVLDTVKSVGQMSFAEINHRGVGSRREDKASSNGRNGDEMFEGCFHYELVSGMGLAGTEPRNAQPT